MKTGKDKDGNPTYHWMHAPYQVKTINLTIPIPLKDNGIVTVSNLSINLTKVEANRICGVILALAENGETE